MAKCKRCSWNPVYTHFFLTHYKHKQTIMPTINKKIVKRKVSCAFILMHFVVVQEKVKLVLTWCGKFCVSFIYVSISRLSTTEQNWYLSLVLRPAHPQKQRAHCVAIGLFSPIAGSCAKMEIMFNQQFSKV